MTSIARMRGTASAVLLLCVFAVACMPTRTVQEIDVPKSEMDSYLSDKPAILRKYYAALRRGGEQNSVLHSMNLGVAAMENGYPRRAAAAFDHAIGKIEAIYVDDPAAAKARSKWHEEGAKDFKGEPYERTMVFYYRGLLYLREGQYDTARACFLNGLIQDAFAEEEQHRCDFVLLEFMAGWAAQCMRDRDLADEHWARIKKLRPDFQAPPWDHNTLFLTEAGKSPRKKVDGVGAYKLVFRRGKNFREVRSEVTAGGQAYATYPIESIYFQAATRGGREVDKVIKGKVEFSKTSTRVGTVFVDAGSVVTAAAILTDASADAYYAGAALSLIGVIVALPGLKTNPRADDRYWKNLPDAVLAATAQLPASTQSAEVRFYDHSGRHLPGLDKRADVKFSRGRSGLVWVRSRNGQSIR